ncbi:hypothetical protein KSX_32290 [Ktedonospora formicarum]|uniref:Uncharacterized protein n=1 Tax=Ktedonospora formicarum TaxID=2778364 RepID=A0A8J3HXJ7_9CHLR|nr:hypothetical protein KSX_32290 [Ktedonospora formicarum]
MDSGIAPASNKGAYEGIKVAALILDLRRRAKFGDDHTPAAVRVKGLYTHDPVPLYPGVSGSIRILVAV